MRYLDLLFKAPGASRVVLVLLAAFGSNLALGSTLTPEQSEKIAHDLSPSQSQRDNRLIPLRSCNSSANAMWLNYFRLFNTDINRQGFVKDDDYLDSVLRKGDTIDHNVQTSTLEAYGVKSYWDTSKSLDKFRTALSEGFPVVVNFWHRGKVGTCGSGNILRGGHVVLVRSSYVKDDGTVMLKVSDPFGQLCSNYTDPATEYEITIEQFKRRWQGGARYVHANKLNQVP